MKEILAKLVLAQPSALGAFYSASIITHIGWGTLNAWMTLIALLYFILIIFLIILEPEFAVGSAKAGSALAVVLFVIQFATGHLCVSCTMMEMMVLITGLWLVIADLAGEGIANAYSVFGCAFLILMMITIIKPMIPVTQRALAEETQEMKVCDEGGNTNVDVSGKTVLVFAPWCMHCHGILKSLSDIPEQKRPVLVCLGNPDKETVAETKNLLGQYNLSSYYGLVKTDQVPLLILPDGRRLTGDRNIGDYLSNTQ